MIDWWARVRCETCVNSQSSNCRLIQVIKQYLRTPTKVFNCRAAH